MPLDLLRFIVVFYFEVPHECPIGNKKGLTISRKPLSYMAPPDGLEPPT